MGFVQVENLLATQSFMLWTKHETLSGKLNCLGPSNPSLYFYCYKLL